MDNLVSLGLRLAVGIFFAISGFHKSFNPIRRNSLKLTFVADGCYSPFMMVAVPAGELLGGIALIVGFLTPVTSLALISLCLGACAFDGFKRIPSWSPLDKADVLDDILYLPEVLYIIMLLAIFFIGPGYWSIDKFLFGPGIFQ